MTKYEILFETFIISYTILCVFIHSFDVILEKLQCQQSFEKKIQTLAL